MGATSIHVQAVKPGSEIHNFREKELDYVRPELSHLEEEFLQKLPSVAELAVGDACTGSNPRSITPAQMADLLKCCYYGTPVNF